MDVKTTDAIIVALLEGGYSPEDAGYATQRLQTLLSIRQVGHRLCRKLTDRERQRAHVLLEEGASVKDVAVALTSRG